MMKTRVSLFVGGLSLMTALFLMPIAFWGAGIWGCGSSSDDGTGGTGTADVSSLASLPSVDLSSYDKSTGTSSTSSLSALEMVLSSKPKSFGENARGVGKPSRAGCEVHSIKDETFRMSQMAQMPRCFLEGMETAGLITIPTDGSLAIYKIGPPEEKAPGGAPEKGKFCGDIPACMSNAKAACEKGEEGPKGKAITVRIGKTSSDTLQIDLCQAGKLVDESLYQASGSKYTLNATHSDTFGGEENKGNITMTVDVGTSGKVTNGTVDLGTDGTADATLKGQGGFGTMTSHFIASAADGSNTVSGAFTSSFKDECTGKSNAMTGRIHGQFTTKGTAKFRGTGNPPPMPFKDMIPFDVPADKKGQFAQQIGAELGIALGATDIETVFFCMSPAFDPANPTKAKGVPPMIPLPSTGTCPEITHTGTESFESKTTEKEGSFKKQKVQVFTTIPDSESPFFDAVKDFDLTTLDPNIEAIAFSRNWDCSGSATEVDFSKADPSKMKEAMQSCFALEEEARARNGLKGRRCEQGDMKNELDNKAQKGGGGTDFGTYGGEGTLQQSDPSTNCAVGTAPDKLFIKPLDTAANSYCLPIDQKCDPFTVSVAGAIPAATGLSITLPGGSTATALNYQTANPPPGFAVTLRNAAGASCNATFALSKPQFTGGGTPTQKQFPEACQKRGLTDEASCRAYCGQPNSGC
ncbi:MAG: hypothetical protein HYS22_07100 [Deltaproteobacteria bacterium]|nr:hypothetical protein [Deltaproteobacteria bacterium]